MRQEIADALDNPSAEIGEISGRGRYTEKGFVLVLNILYRSSQLAGVSSTAIFFLNGHPVEAAVVAFAIGSQLYLEQRIREGRGE